MKVSIDGVLNTARRLKGQNYLEEEALNRKKEKIGKDSVEISKRINSRLISIQKELNDIQSSLTRNQIIKEGISLLIDDSANGGNRQETIMNELKFGNERVLSNYVGENPGKNDLETKFSSIESKIEKDTSSLKKLQIEVENILASNLADNESQNVIQNIEQTITTADSILLKNISDLKPEMVMNLIN